MVGFSLTIWGSILVMYLGNRGKRIQMALATIWFAVVLLAAWAAR